MGPPEPFTSKKSPSRTRSYGAHRLAENRDSTVFDPSNKYDKNGSTNTPRCNERAPDSTPSSALVQTASYRIRERTTLTKSSATILDVSIVAAAASAEAILFTLDPPNRDERRRRPFCLREFFDAETIAEGVPNKDAGFDRAMRNRL